MNSFLFAHTIVMAILLASCSSSSSQLSLTTENDQEAGGNTVSSPDSGDPGDSMSNSESEPDSNMPTESNQTGINYSDDFSTDTLADWTRRHQQLGEPAQYTLLDVNQTQAGALTIEPTLTPGWFADGSAPLIYKTVSGNFIVEGDFLAESVANPGQAPSANFNSVGLMARDPVSETADENYVMVNIGRQSGGQTPVIGTETKTTRNSVSNLDIQAGTNRGQLILCRVGDLFLSYRFLDNETEWLQIGAVNRPDMPKLLQLGMVANGFAGPDLRATVFDISLRTPSSENDCTPG